MDEMAVPQEFKPKYVTQEEASAVVELWARLDASKTRANLLTIADLSESLQISEAEAERLLDQVRHQRPSAEEHHVQDMSAITWFGALCLAASICAAAFFLVISIGNEYNRDDRSERAAMFAAFTWIAGWAWYFRRPLKRAIRNFFHGKS